MIVLFLDMLDEEADKVLFRQVAERNIQRMYQKAYGILKDSMLAEDAVQEAFLKLAEKFPGYQKDDGNKLDHLCVKIVERKAIDIYRRREKELLTFEGELPEQGFGRSVFWSKDEAGATDYQIIAEGSMAESPEIQIIHREEKQELRQRMRKALETLSSKERQVLMLKKYDELSSREKGEIRMRKKAGYISAGIVGVLFIVSVCLSLLKLQYNAEKENEMELCVEGKQQYLDCDNSTIAIREKSGEITVIGGNTDNVIKRENWKGKMVSVHDGIVRTVTEQGDFQSNSALSYKASEEYQEEAYGMETGKIMRSGTQIEELRGIKRTLYCNYPLSYAAVMENGELVIISADNNENICFPQKPVDPVQAIITVGDQVLVLNQDGTVTASENWYAWYASERDNGTRYVSLCETTAGFVIGITVEGRVKAVWGSEDAVRSRGYDYQDWENIIALDYGQAVLAGLTAEGTLRVTGPREKEYQEVLDWKGIKAFAVSDKFMVGWKENGMLKWMKTAEESVEGLEKYRKIKFERP